MTQDGTEKKKRKFSLVRAFTKAVLGIVAAVTMAYGAWYGIFYAGKGEQLTQGERQSVREIFGDEVNPDRIRKHFKPADHITHVFGWAQGTVIPPFSHIDFFGDWARSRDFSSGDRSHFGFFMHEVTHTWQGQNFRFSFNNIGRYDYEYMLTGRSRFSDFGTEQQAELVEAYAENWLHPESASRRHTRADTLVARVVENEFPQARITRDSLERVRADSTRTNTPAASAPGPAKPA